VWCVPTAGGWPEQLTFYQERIGMVEFSPVADELVFGMDAGGNERQQLFLLKGDGSEVKQLTHEPEAIHSFGGWAHDGRRIAFASNRSNPRHFHVYIMDIRSGEARLVFERDGTNRPVGWSPDDRRLLIVRANTNMDHDIFLFDLEDGVARHVTPHEGEAAFVQPCWDPEGLGFYVISNQDRDLRALLYYDLESETFSPVVEGEHEVEGVVVSPDGSHLAYTINNEGYSELWLLERDSGSRRRVESLPVGVCLSMDWLPNGDGLSVSLSGPRHNTNVWVVDAADGSSRQLTRASSAGIPLDALVEPELIHYESFDGLEIPAFYYRPPSVAGPLPVIVDIHGGPEGQRRVNFNPVTQYLVDCGYAVFAPNVRGSAGYGKEYIHLDDVENRMDTVTDIKHGVDWLISQGGADPGRIAVMGGSYGGFMVLACITEYPDLWAAAVDVVGIANFVTFLQNTGPWRRHLREAEYGSLENDYEFLVSVSPIHKAHHIKAPLMVIHGANDPRVPIGEAEQIVDSVKGKGGIVHYLRFEDEGHGLVKLPNRIEAYRKVADFLELYLASPKRHMC